MNSYRQSNVKRDRRRLFWGTALVVIIFIIDGISGGNLRGAVRLGGANVWSVGTHAGDAIFGSGFFSTRRALEEENQSLRGEISELQMRAAAFDVLREENAALQGLVHLAEGSRGITAPVVSSFRSSPYGTFLIGAGTEDGVRSGSIVLVGDSLRQSADGGFVIGRIEEAGAHTSLVKGIFAPGVTTDAVIREVGISVLGRGGGQARGEIPREALVAAGDPVVSATLGGKPIGIVGKVVEDAGDASQVVYIRFPINQNEIRFVYVLPAQQ